MIYYLLAVVLSVGILAFFLLWNKPIILIYLEIIFCLVNKVFITQIGFPEFFKYIAELICLYLLVWAFIIHYKKKIKTYALLPFIVIVMLIFVSVISYVVHNYSLGLYLEGMLKIYRFAAFFYICIIFLDQKEVKRILNLLIVFLFLNVISSSTQYFIQGIRWDYNGGLFGIQVGGNAEMNVFLVITSIIAAVLGINKKINIFLSAAIIGGGIYIALLSELKIYYVELIVILILVAILSKPSVRSIFFLSGGILVIFTAINLLGKLYPLFADFFDIQTMINYAMKDEYGGTTGNLNRLTALPYVLDNLLVTPVDKVLGIGMGNADVGTALHIKYSYLKYDWYFNSYYIFENGLLGFVLYCFFFLSTSISGFYFAHRDPSNRVYYLISAIIGFFPLLFMIYDASLLSLVSYILFFMLAVPFIIYRESNGLRRG